jgi:ABC-type amino acid transport substrate-binding protein
VLADGVAGLYAVRQLKLDGIGRAAPPLLRFDTSLVFRKNVRSPALAAAFDRVLTRMRHDGSMARLTAAYPGATPTEP